MDKMGPFAQTIMNQKYAHDLEEGKETWEQIAARVSKHVMKSVGAGRAFGKEIEQLIASRKFMPGGRYLYAAGRQFHQVQNCLLLKADDSREGWADLMQKATMALMTGAGIGVVYSALRHEGAPIRKTGGVATGPIALAQMVNEAGRGIMQGGSRRSAIWAGLHWNHPDIHKFIQLKNWRQEVVDLKEKDYNFPATMDGTNISVILDDAFFKAYGDDKHKNHSLAHSVYWAVVKQMLKTAEPGFSVDVGVNAGEHLRNAPVVADTYVLTSNGYRRVGDIVGHSIEVWTGQQWSKTVFKKTAVQTPVVTVTMTGRKEITCDPTHPFILADGERVPAGRLRHGQKLAMNLGLQPHGLANPNAYLLGAIYGDGSFSGNKVKTAKPQRAELPLCGDKEGLLQVILASDLQPTSHNHDSRGILRLYYSRNELFGSRSKREFPSDVYGWDSESRLAFLAGLSDTDGNDHGGLLRISSIHQDFLRGVGRIAESVGLTAIINKGSAGKYIGTPTWMLIIRGELTKIPTHRLKLKNTQETKFEVLSVEDSGLADVFCCDVGVPEHSFQAEGILISNCTEVTSHDDSDICNLGSINMAKIDSLEEMERAVELGTAFLMAGTVYSDVPYAKVDQVRTKNRRLGLGLMGLHEWLLKRGKKYGPDAELEEYLKIYAKSGEFAKKYAEEWSLSVPVKTRAIAPTGTIGIVAETTTGIEPIFCVAYKRRYLKGDVVHYQYVVDPCAQRLVDSGISPDAIEDAYSLAEDVERRVAFQAWVQRYVDHSISSTINLPSWGSELNNDNRVQDFGNMLIKYLPELRGTTVYPDGARGGQPLTPVKYTTAMRHIGEVFIEQADVCDISKGGSCG